MGVDLPTHPSIQSVAKKPDPPFTKNWFPGHAAWIVGDWKVHRIEGKQGPIRHELDELASDRVEAADMCGAETKRSGRMRSHLKAWLGLAADGSNGEDCER